MLEPRKTKSELSTQKHPTLEDEVKKLHSALELFVSFTKEHILTLKEEIKQEVTETLKADRQKLIKAKKKNLKQKRKTLSTSKQKLQSGLLQRLSWMLEGIFIPPA